MLKADLHTLDLYSVQEVDTEPEYCLWVSDDWLKNCLRRVKIWKLDYHVSENLREIVQSALYGSKITEGVDPKSPLPGIYPEIITYGAKENL